ncbi:MAG: HDIG domain-containing protein [Deltaproteobacteria bacterium]|nr:HDIG domain-containing protein [Deltaproteobacteria bacterium]
MLASIEKCFALMEKYRMPDNIRAHSIVVKEVAILLADGINKNGAKVSLEKVITGALMHDIGKALCFNSPHDHAIKGMEICIQNGLYEIADIVEEHITLKSYDKRSPVSEKEIVYYADKRVNHDKIVSLEKRLEYLIDRYAMNQKGLENIIKQNFIRCREVEVKLFSYLQFDPEDIADMIV